MMRGRLPIGQMMTGCPDVGLKKTASLAVEWMMTVLGGMRRMTDLPGVWVMMTGQVGATQTTTDHLDVDWMMTEEAGGQQMRTEDRDAG